MIFQASFYKSKKLLLIEDCEPVRASIKGMLQQIGFDNITTVADAAQAMPMTSKDSFDFILADFDLGSGKDALQFFADLSQQAVLRVGCCFILMSAEPRRMPVLGLLQGAPDAFILKPFSYVELEKRLAKAWNNRVKLRKAYQAVQQQDYKTAQLELDPVINAVNSSSLPALRLMAEVLMADHSYSAALKLYEQVTQQRDFSWALLGQAVALLQLQEYQAAESRLMSLIEQDDTRPEALEWLCCLHLRQGKTELAAKQLAELMKLNNVSVQAHKANGCIMLLQGQQEESSKYWQKQIQQYRFSAFDQADYYFALTRIQLEQAQRAPRQEFSARLKKAGDTLALMPQKLVNEGTEAELTVLRAMLSLLQGNIAEAQQQLEQVLTDYNPADPESIVDIARLAFALGDMKQADACLAKLKDFKPAKADLTGECQRLTAQYLLQQEQQLRGQIRQWNQAGMEQAQTGKPEQALTLLRQAFVFMPCNAALVLNLLQTLTQLPADKTLKPLAKSAMAALEFSTKSAANQQRLAQLLPQLPQLYLD
ncbi:tetratricopeptide repeat protein [Rheinheimera aquimaris]|uniref:tetratricopeptide repeat protein n=1 Tax=Rheinheimera aquimaris TaxID=412437 RepID=UPI003A979E5F